MPRYVQAYDILNFVEISITSLGEPQPAPSPGSASEASLRSWRPEIVLVMLLRPLHRRHVGLAFWEEPRSVARTCTIHRGPRKPHRLHRERDDIFHHVLGYHRCAMNSTRLKGAAVASGKPSLAQPGGQHNQTEPGTRQSVWRSAPPRPRAGLCGVRAAGHGRAIGYHVHGPLRNGPGHPVQGFLTNFCRICQNHPGSSGRLTEVKSVSCGSFIMGPLLTNPP